MSTLYENMLLVVVNFFFFITVFNSHVQVAVLGIQTAASSQGAERRGLFTRQVFKQTLQVLCVDSGIGVYQPKTACVSTINTRRSPWLWKQASGLTAAPQSHSGCHCFLRETTVRCVALPHLTQSVPLVM